MKYIMALDQGTTSSRAILFTHEGNIAGIAQKETRQLFPADGWVEQDADEIWSTQIGVASEVMAKKGISASDINAIGITNQRETTIVWDKNTGRPIHNAIVWQDRRTADICNEYKNKGLEKLFRDKTGLIIDSYFSGTKVAWLLDNIEGARQKAEKGELLFGTVDSWIIWKLTNGEAHVTDPSNASRTLMFNIHTQQWDDELLEILNVPKIMLPKVCSSSEIYAKTRSKLLGGEISIAGIAGDQQAATFGQGCHKKGMAKSTYGTGCFMLLNTGSDIVPSENNLLTTIGWGVNDKITYCLEGSVFIAGAAVQWLRDGLEIIKKSSDVEDLARSVPDSNGVYLVPAFTGLGAPHWDPYARGTIVGLTRGANKAHIARATLESIAYQTADVLQAMMEDSGVSLSELRVDGGASKNNLLMQFQADILGVPVVRPKITETTALGAAYLAGMATGFWQSQHEIAAQWQIDVRFEPRMDASKRDSLLMSWQRAVRKSRAWIRP